jgi:hypothetical protein
MKIATLQLAWKKGITPIIYFGRLQATREDGVPLTESDKCFLWRNKTALAKEISSLGKKSGIPIDLEKIGKL